ncbi:ISPg4, transposase [Aquipluma nitroreducens]|uniref:ISPg4, transposase n=1 Tax=Aquipluma nitroreducens TaxID=2010828 RepID=A0A5K7SA23_9BACT|nr:IS4 family transposase [Aquipluma nitroreducens]BBE17480.1 mobile element protein [Aquipluma nitroreducens]BBE18316.1 mobile element protein [Aquipluma nitroreducens]BBE18561.1 ISPg4, transposase [Aquipluma nitroreducens]
MNSGKYVFAQLLQFVSKYEFERCVERYQGDYHVRELNCWNQFVQLFFGQLTSRNSLRDICTCLKAHKNKLYHLGIKQNVNQSSLSRANERRDWRIFADFGEYLIKMVRPLYANSPIPNIDIDNDIFALDSTTISLSIKLFSWAKGKYSRGAVKIHTLLDLRGSIPAFIFITDGKYHDSNILDIMGPIPEAIYLMDKAYVDFAALYNIHRAGAFFVTRAKVTLDYSVIECNYNIDERSGLRSDKTINLNGYKSKKLYPEMLRLVEYYDDEKNILLVFLSNNFEVSAMEIAYLYRNRWQIEVFFKWIKQNLTIKKLWGNSENAVALHIWVAICTYLIVAYVKYSLKSTLSIYEIMQILGISVFDKAPVKELITELEVNQNFKEQYDLFNDQF